MIYKRTPLNLYGYERYKLATEQKIKFPYRMNYYHQLFLRKCVITHLRLLSPQQLTRPAQMRLEELLDVTQHK
jgi:hypothetical protein